MNFRNLFYKYLFYRWLFGSHSCYDNDREPSDTSHCDFDDGMNSCLGFDDDQDDFDLMDDDF